MEAVNFQVGQATTIHHWVFEDGSEGGPAAFKHVDSTQRPSDKEVQQAGAHRSPRSDLSDCGICCTYTMSVWAKSCIRGLVQEIDTEA